MVIETQEKAVVKNHGVIDGWIDGAVQTWSGGQMERHRGKE